ncbi:MAG: SOUL family heme-binding protein [Actinomycetota bacterium]
MTEVAPYELVKDFGEFELRRYPQLVLIQTKVSGGFLAAGNLGFGPLVRFISGNNQSRQKIAMTAPVMQESINQGLHVVSFVMPTDLGRETTPAPIDPAVKVIEMPEHLAAARKFSGSWNQERFQKEGQELLKAVSGEGLKSIGNLYWSRFDPPWKPGFLKRNEVLIRIES